MTKSMKPKKKVVKKTTANPLAEYRATFGTPNNPGSIHEFVREAKMKETAIRHLEERRPWCARINTDGGQAINAAISEVNALPPLTPDPVVITCVLDEATRTTLQIRLWKK